MLGKEIRYPGEALDEFEVQMRRKARAMDGLLICLSVRGYLERGFVAGDGEMRGADNYCGHARGGMRTSPGGSRGRNGQKK